MIGIYCVPQQSSIHCSTASILHNDLRMPIVSCTCIKLGQYMLYTDLGTGATEILHQSLLYVVALL